MADVTDEASQESLAEAQALLSQTGIHKAAEAPHPAQTQAASTETKKTRTTVAKLAQRYQERDAELSMQIIDAQQQVEEAIERVKALRYRQSVWREALEEINAE